MFFDLKPFDPTERCQWSDLLVPQCAHCQHHELPAEYEEVAL